MHIQGDLGCIPQQYDVAVSTVGGRLHNLVVEDFATCNRIVKMLKDRSLGRANFVVLDNIQNMKRQMQASAGKQL